MSTKRNFFTYYRFEIIFCFTLFLFGFFLLGLTDFAFAQIADPTNGIGTKAPPQDPGVDKNFLEKKIDNLIYTISTTIGMAVISLGGLLLDASINYGVLKMGSILSPSSPLGIGVLQIWAVIRDILNILFIFGLIYVGISTILDSHKSETQRVLGRLIIAALFVNFSLYATQVVVDFTNILAIQVHNQIIGTQGSLAQGFSDTILPLDKNSISGAFLNTAGITSVLGGDKSGVIETLSTGKVFFYSIFMMTFLIIAGIVFAIGAVLLITRFAALILYMIFSPFMFAGWIFPKLGHASEEYWSWNKLLKQALFAPAFLFMLYLSLVVLQRLQGVISPKGGQFSNMIVSGASAVDTFSMVMFFALMIVFLFASIKIASSMGVMGAEGASSLMGSVKNRMMVTAGGATAGMAGRIGRATVGRYAHETAESESMKDWASRSVIGRAALGVARYGQDASFDARKVNGVGKSIGIGEGAKGGYKTVLSDVKKKEEAYAKSLGEVEDDDPRVAEFMAEKEAFKAKLKEAKMAKAKAVGSEAKQKVQEEIDEINEAIKHQDEIIKTEKARRQIGSYVDPATEDSTKERYAEAKDNASKAKKNISETSKIRNDALNKIKEARKDLADDSLTLEMKKVIQTEMEGHEKDLKSANEAFKEAAAALKENNHKMKELKMEAKENTGNIGYAGSLEAKGKLATMKSWATGRMASHDRAAGKSVRKNFSKGHAKDEARKHEEKAHDGDHDDHGAKSGGKDAHAAH